MSYGDVDGNLTLDLQKKRNNKTNYRLTEILELHGCNSREIIKIHVLLQGAKKKKKKYNV